MTLLISKLILRVKHPEVLTVSDINEAVVAAPAVRMNHGVKCNMTANHPLQRAFATILNNLGIEMVKFCWTQYSRCLTLSF